eukprot:Skav227486  [mRNA]  locus=scaffold282:28269:28490:+ [translate_table: standard]
MATLQQSKEAVTMPLAQQCVAPELLCTCLILNHLLVVTTAFIISHLFGFFLGSFYRPTLVVTASCNALGLRLV